MKVIWFRMAINDLIALKANLSQGSPQAAQKTVYKIKQAISLLSDQPGMGRPGRVPYTKELVIQQTSYIVPYRVRDNKIEILRVLHTSRKWPKSF
ncbi:MAG: type II toxin-antitoxin system RelE/ParE family toxin [Algicola sp.]|nr:type II toxin-antitoxin system RelE/ParE family toxin [Algicola sp.]